ncbi:sugar transferase [Novosphingobium profundi]|uniref:sugar transferase n=1 Tax=Novosphingobium profundi TaxID=1774954 RepID=UPI001CFEDFEA|nr:sugar transferase [Novosphingobium profundi]
MFDILIAMAILVLIAPFLLLLTALLFLNDPGPVFYAHRRVGYRGRFFPCLKFRTMRIDGDAILQRYLAENPAAQQELAVTYKLRDDPRVTAVGAILRKFSLDEFPQLFNVLAGQMSIVGPRPVVLAEVERYGRQFEVYCRVRPGLTGLWQISGRSDVSYATRVRMDIDYVCRKGLALDLWLLFRTIPAVAFSRGAY